VAEPVVAEFEALERTLAERHRQVEATLRRLLVPGRSPQVTAAMEDSLFAPAKRLRPILALLVAEILRGSFPVSLFLGTLAFLIASLGGLALGILAAVHQNRGWDYLSVSLATFGVAVPNFVLAVKDALEADKPLLLTLHKKSRNPLLQDIRRRDDVRILEVTMVNRNLLPYKIVKLMKGEVL